jgi:proliferating cell nuclear antigen PCNA
MVTVFSLKNQEPDNIFRKIIDFLSFKDFISQLFFICKGDGVYIQSMDSSHISLVNIFIDKKAFLQYNWTKDFLFGVDLEKFSQILKTPPSNSTSSEISFSNNTSLLLKYKYDTRLIAKYTMKLVEDTASILPLPTIKFTFQEPIDFFNSSRIFTDLSRFSSDVYISRNKEGFDLSNCNGSSCGDVIQATFNLECLEENFKIPYNIVLSIKYLLWFNKLANINSTFLLSGNIDDNSPIKLSLGNDFVECVLFISRK